MKHNIGTSEVDSFGQDYTMFCVLCPCKEIKTDLPYMQVMMVPDF